MKLLSLKLYNFGVYRGENRFDFSGDKPVVLIGGMNGRGKTTFLEAVLAALYGHNSIAFAESGFATFGQYLKAKTNTDNGDTVASIELVFSVERNGVSEVFAVKRSWDAASKRIRIDTTVRRDGAVDAFLTDNWAAYVEDILPRALSGFFFFDGEKIAELALDGSDEQIRESMRALMGVNTVDILEKDLRTLAKRLMRADTSNSACETETLARDVDLLTERLAALDKKIASSSSMAESLEREIEGLRGGYLSTGGDALKARILHEEREKQLLHEIDQLNNEGVAIASGVAPLAMFKNEMGALTAAVTEEFEAKTMTAALDKLTQILSTFEGADEREKESIASFIEHASQDSRSADNRFDATAADVAEMKALPALLEKAATEYGAYTATKSSLDQQLEETRNYLSLEVNEAEAAEMLSKIEEKVRCLTQEQANLSSLVAERSSVNGDYIRTNAEYKRAMRKYLDSLDETEDDLRALKYIDIASRIFERYETMIQERKADTLARAIGDCYKKLANKNSLIETITMDPKTLELAYQAPDGKPVERALLSAGEKQLMVISTLWALAKCSEKKLPVIIDTPLARLDSAHRISIVKEYFPNASEQTIILSTDSEIYGEYYDALSPNIANEFTLVYSDKDKATTIVPGYFKDGEVTC